VKRQRLGLSASGWCGNCQRLALVSVGLHFKSPAGAGWPCPWQAVSVAKVNGFGFCIRVGGPAWDGRLAASGSWAEVSLREFGFWLKQKQRMSCKIESGL